MRFFGVIFFLIVLLGMSSCSVNEYEQKLQNNFPEIDQYIISEQLASYSDVECSVKEYESYTFNGYQEPNGKCSFFDTKLETGKTTVTSFTFLIDGERQYDMIVYEFDNDEDLKKLKKFIPEASLFYEKNKEIHEFLEAEDKVYLYYFGFP